VVAVGVTIGEPVKLPGIQVYVVPPVALNVEEDPAQILAADALATIVGNEFTVSVTVDILVQPLAFVPVTV